MVQWLRLHADLPEGLVQFPAPRLDSSKLPIIACLGKPGPLVLAGTSTHVHTLTHIDIINSKVHILKMINSNQTPRIASLHVSNFIYQMEFVSIQFSKWWEGLADAQRKCGWGWGRRIRSVTGKGGTFRNKVFDVFWTSYDRQSGVHLDRKWTSPAKNILKKKNLLYLISKSTIKLQCLKYCKIGMGLNRFFHRAQ